MPRARQNRWRTGLIRIGLLVVVLGGVTAPKLVPTLVSKLRSKSSKPSFETKKVERANLDVTLTTGGRIDSSERTIIECELERLGVSVRGQGYMAGGSAVILKLVPEGTEVKKGDILCELDSFDYVEMLSQQRINLERVKSDHEQAVINLEVAKLSIVEYRDGLMLQNLKDLRGKIALAESDLERNNDRLKWTRNMLEKGYVPQGQVTTEEFVSNRLALTLQQNRTALALFEEFSAPKYIKVLESNVQAAETSLSFQTQRLQRTDERLKKLQSQVDLCTIRAPHDGFLIYAGDPRRNIVIEEGISVYQRQPLFYLPDLAKMEAIALIHESVVDEVKPGMSVQVQVEGLPGRTLKGHVIDISQLPTVNGLNDVREFVGTIKLDTIPKGLKPGMTAEIEIGLTKRADVLTIPSESLTVELGEDFCYVVRDDHVERRPITLGRSSRALLEITAGLNEGDEVVVDPGRLGDSTEIAEAHADLEPSGTKRDPVGHSTE